jgi:ABC-type multidrug transport system fused ATPase/permease subunit
MKQAKALSAWADGYIPPERDKKHEADRRGFSDVIKIFIRSWPFLSPYIFGYWREVSRVRTTRTDAKSDSSKEGASTDGAPTGGEWSFRHVPPLVTVLAVIGPTTGLLPVGIDWTRDLLVAATAAMTILTWVLMFAKGRVHFGASLALALIGIASFLFAVFAVAGQADNIQVGLVCSGCVCIWVLQYRIEGGKVRFRVRLGSHLIYYFLLAQLYVLVLMISLMFTVDVLNQSVLQAQPLTPFLANFIFRPELAEGTLDASATDVEGMMDSKGTVKGADKKPTTGEPGFDKGGGEAGFDKSSRKADFDKGGGKAGFGGKGKSAEPNIALGSLTREQRHSLKWVYAVFAFGAWLILCPIILAQHYYFMWILQQLNHDLRMALVVRWHRLSLRYHGDHRVGDSVYRIYQDSAQVTAVIGAVMKVFQGVLTYAAAVLVLAAMDPLLGVMALSVALLAIAWGRWFSPRMRGQSLAAREANSDLTSRIQETFAGIRVIKAYGTEELEQERFDKDSIVAFNTAFRVRTLIAVVGIVMFTLSAALLLGAEFMMAVWASGGRETFATVLIGLVGLSFVTWNLSAFRYFQRQFGEGSAGLGGMVQQWAQAQDMAMGLDRVFNILDIEPDVKNHPDAVPMGPFSREIRFDNIDFAYEPGRPVLRNISLAVEPGTITAIVGPTGSGKSTLMSLLCRLFDPDSGGITIDGVDLRKLDLDSLRDNVSIALQENVLFGTSVRDNIRYVVPDADDERVLRAAAVACVDDYVAGLPEGLDTVLSDRGGKLSTGERQRLSIARAVIKDTPILILDEPTAALDAHTEHRVLDRLTTWGGGRAIFLITHRISTIQRADQILYLDDGEIVESGSHEELMQLPDGRYRSFVETEARLSKRPTGEERPEEEHE